MAHFDLSNYATVAERITQFYADHPDGRIHTRLLSGTEGKQTQFIVHAEIYLGDDERPVATGMAEEHFADRGPNETSPLENAETSAIGRALVNWKYSSTASDRPSREEMAKVNNYSKPQQGSGVPDHVKQEVKRVVQGDKIDPKTDERWGWIVKASRELPENHKSYKFVTDIADKGSKWSLSEKQIGAAFKAACEFLGQPSKASMEEVATVADAFPGAAVEPETYEPF